MASTKFKAEKPASDGPRYPTEDIIQGPFSFGPCGFLVNQIPRESAKSLKRLLYPEMFTESRTTKLIQDDDTVIDASWIEAQLQHYGIQCRPDIGPFKAKALLLTSLSHGLVGLSPFLPRHLRWLFLTDMVVRYRPSSNTQNPNHPSGEIQSRTQRL